MSGLPWFGFFVLNAKAFANKLRSLEILKKTADDRLNRNVVVDDHGTQKKISEAVGNIQEQIQNIGETDPNEIPETLDALESHHANVAVELNNAETAINSAVSGLETEIDELGASLLTNPEKRLGITDNQDRGEVQLWNRLVDAANSEQAKIEQARKEGVKYQPSDEYSQALDKFKKKMAETARAEINQHFINIPHLRSKNLEPVFGVIESIHKKGALDYGLPEIDENVVSQQTDKRMKMGKRPNSERETIRNEEEVKSRADMTKKKIGIAATLFESLRDRLLKNPNKPDQFKPGTEKAQKDLAEAAHREMVRLANQTRVPIDRDTQVRANVAAELRKNNPNWEPQRLNKYLAKSMDQYRNDSKLAKLEPAEAAHTAIERTRMEYLISNQFRTEITKRENARGLEKDHERLGSWVEQAMVEYNKIPEDEREQKSDSELAEIAVKAMWEKDKKNGPSIMEATSGSALFRLNAAVTLAQEKEKAAEPPTLGF